MQAKDIDEAMLKDCMSHLHRLSHARDTSHAQVTELLADAKEQVKKAANEAMSEACMCSGNRDIEPFVPHLVTAMANPKEVPETVHKLGAMVFVQVRFGRSPS